MRPRGRPFEHVRGPDRELGVRPLLEDRGRGAALAPSSRRCRPSTELPAADDAAERRTCGSAVSRAVNADSVPLPLSRTGEAICTLHPGGCTAHAAVKPGLSTTSPVVFSVYRPMTTSAW